MSKVPTGAPATGRLVEAPKLVSGARAAWLLLVVTSLALVAVLIAASGAEAAPTPLRLGNPADTHHVVPGVMAPWNTHAVDLDADTNEEIIITSGDGVLQKYDANGRYLWGLDAQTIADHEGILAESAGHFIGAQKHLLPTTESGIIFHDVNGDLVLDIITSTYLAVDAPANSLQSALIQVDGLTGQLISVSLRPGFIHHVVIGNYDTDAAQEILIVEENGARHLNGAKTHWIGSNGTTRLYVENLDGTPGWSFDTGRGWGQVTAITRARTVGDGPDITFAVTQAFDKFKHDLDDEVTHFTQDLISLDGKTATVQWTLSTLDYVREIARYDPDGDNYFDLVLRIQEPQDVQATSRGDQRGHVQLIRADGMPGWTTIGTHGHLPRLFDMELRMDGLPTVAVAFTTASEAAYAAEDQVHIELRQAGDGVFVDNVRLNSGAAPEITMIGGLLTGLLGDDILSYPSQVSAIPQISGMCLVQTDIDGNGLTDLVVANDRGLAGIVVGGTGLTPLWHTPVSPDRHIFFAVDVAGPTQVWTQDVSSARLSAFRATDGSHVKDIPLVSMMLGVTRADLDADADLDRVVGGTSGTLFAFDAASQNVLWQRAVGRHVVDVTAADVDGDGRQDLLWVGDLEAGAVKSDGTVLWTHRHTFADDGGEYRDWQYADLNGDDVPDIVLAYRTGSNQGSAPTRLAQVLALNGADGSALWTHTLPPPIWAVGGLDVRDVDGDGVPDVAFSTQTAAEAVYYGVGLLNGANGLPKWRVDLTVHGGQGSLSTDGVAIVDADGDHDLDVVAPTRGGSLFPAALRAHDGLTGLLLWERPVDRGANLLNEGIHRGPIGPAGAEALLVHSVDQDTGAHRLGAMTPQAGRLYNQTYAGIVAITDMQFGDVDGDGIDDVVIATPQGLVVLDSGPKLGGTTRHLGHVTQWAPSKVRLFDVDNDDKMEMEFLSDPQNYPVHIGALRITDLARGKAFGTADMDSFVPPPVNLPPVADFVVLTTPVIQGDNATFRSTSYDPDVGGSIVNETWTFADGETLYGNEVNKTFNVSGPQKVSLAVMDNNGKVTTIAKTLEVRPLFGFTAEQARSGTRASPNSTFVFTFRVNNTGVNADTFTASILRAPDDWIVNIDNGTVQLAPGESHNFTVTTTVVSSRPATTATRATLNSAPSSTRSALRS